MLRNRALVKLYTNDPKKIRENFGYILKLVEKKIQKLMKIFSKYIMYCNYIEFGKNYASHVSKTIKLFITFPEI